MFHIQTSLDPIAAGTETAAAPASTTETAAPNADVPGIKYSGFRIRIRTDPHVFALPGSGSGQKGKEMNE